MQALTDQALGLWKLQPSVSLRSCQLPWILFPGAGIVSSLSRLLAVDWLNDCQLVWFLQHQYLGEVSFVAVALGPSNVRHRQMQWGHYRCWEYFDENVLVSIYFVSWVFETGPQFKIQEILHSTISEQSQPTSVRVMWHRSGRTLGERRRRFPKEFFSKWSW